MSRYDTDAPHPHDPDWADLGLKVAELHLDLAVNEASKHRDMRGKLEALSVTVLNDAVVPPEYRRSYKERIDTALGSDEFCSSCSRDGCLEETNNREFADYWHFKAHNYPIDAPLCAVECKGCQSVFLTYDWQDDTCGGWKTKYRCRHETPGRECHDDEQLRVWDDEWFPAEDQPTSLCRGCRTERVHNDDEQCRNCIPDVIWARDYLDVDAPAKVAQEA